MSYVLLTGEPPPQVLGGLLVADTRRSSRPYNAPYRKYSGRSCEY
jgi:hypothetical protein